MLYWFLAEPPDIRNWFPSYQYESFVWDTYDEFGGSIFKEIECDGDGFVLVGERNGEKEGHLGDSKRSDDKHEDQFLSKVLIIQSLKVKTTIYPCHFILYINDGCNLGFNLGT